MAATQPFQDVSNLKGNPFAVRKTVKDSSSHKQKSVQLCGGAE